MHVSLCGQMGMSVQQHACYACMLGTGQNRVERAVGRGGEMSDAAMWLVGGGVPRGR